MNGKLKVSIEASSTLFIEGQSSVEILKGRYEIFGAEYEGDLVFTVDPYKVVPVYALTFLEAVVEGGRVWSTPKRTIPESWAEVAEYVAEREARKVLVMGGVDTGKTGLVTFMVNRLVKRGFRVGVIDADTGQSDIGPPTTVGLGVVERPIVLLSQVQFVDAVFIGLTSPAELFHRSIAAVRALADKALGGLKCDFLLVDTTGWVTGEGGRDLKLYKIMALNPDLIIALEESGELSHILKYVEKFYEVYRVEPAIELRPRSREERRVIRNWMYSRFFENAQVVELRFDDVVASGGFTFTGRKLSGSGKRELSNLLGVDVLYGELLEDRLLLVVDGEYAVPEGSVDAILKEFGVEKIHVLKPEDYRHVLIAFSSRQKLLEGLGIIADIDWSGGIIKIVASHPIREKPILMQWGYIRINPDTFEEEEWVEKWRL